MGIPWFTDCAVVFGIYNILINSYFLDDVLGKSQYRPVSDMLLPKHKVL